MGWWLEFALVLVALLAGIAGVAALIIHIGNRLADKL